MDPEALRTGKLCGQQLPFMDMAWVLLADSCLLGKNSDDPVLGGTESLKRCLYLCTVYFTGSDPGAENCLQSSFVLKLSFISVIFKILPGIILYILFRFRNLISISEYMNFSFIKQNILVGRGM